MILAIGGAVIAVLFLVTACVLPAVAQLMAIPTLILALLGVTAWEAGCWKRKH